MFEYNEELGKVDFCHNPFSMPQGGMDALKNKDPLDILAFQYDIVINQFVIFLTMGLLIFKPDNLLSNYLLNIST
jgi:aspartyl-tRNA synthetase